MKRLFVEPLDVLMFRSESPFIARETHVAKLGNISPLTFEGAIKSKLFLDFCKEKNYSPSDFQRKKKRNETKKDFMITKDELIKSVKERMEECPELKELLETVGYSPLGYTSKLTVLGVFPAEKNKKIECFPMPNDIVTEDRDDGDIVKITPSKKIKMDDDLRVVIASKYSKVTKADGVIEFSELKKYLWGELPKQKKIKYKDPITDDEIDLNKPYFKEIRTGIQLDRYTKKTVEGHLYVAEFLRLLNDWGFIIWYESPKTVSGGIIRLGGEGKGAILDDNIDEKNVSEELNFPELIESINKDKKFKLYFASPSYFGGYKPPEDELRDKLGVTSLELVAAIPGKPIYIGGYDFAMNKEKSLKRWVAAGAVYYYKFEGIIKYDLHVPIKILDKNENVRMTCGFIGRW